MTEEGEFKKRIKNLVDDILESEQDEGTISLNDSWFLQVIDEAKKEIFPLPLVDILLNPNTGQRDLVQMPLKDWLYFINRLRKWFGERRW